MIVEVSGVSGVWADSPSKAALEPGRLLFGNLVAEQIGHVQPGQDSVVFGLVGPWGSGKTSLIDHVQGQLENEWKIVQMSPWAASDTSGIQLDFLKALASSFPKEEKEHRFKDFASKYARFATPLLQAVPAAGNALQVIAEETIESWTEQRPWLEEFHALAEVLRLEEQRVLIVADDIDRLDAEELLALLKVVRLIGRFPNVHYLLAYDQASVEELLRDRGFQGASSAFMEKIVQFPLEVPPLARADRRMRVWKGLSRMMALQPETAISEAVENRLSELLELLTEVLETPRSLSRFDGQLAVFASGIDLSEIDRLDFAALTYLRVFDHEVWLAIPAWRQELMSGQRRTTKGEIEAVSEDHWFDKVSRQSSHSRPEIVLRFLSFLFPNVSAGGMSYFSSHTQGLHTPGYFERYFILGVSSDDVSDRAVEEALIDLDHDQLLSNNVAQLAKVIDESEVARSAVAAEKCLAVRQAGESSNSSYLKFVGDRLWSRRNLADDPAGPTPVLRRWLARELYWAITSSSVNVATVRCILDDEVLLSAIDTMDRRVFPREQVSAIRGQFSESFRTSLLAPTPPAVGEPRLFRRKLALILSSGDEMEPGLLDEFVQDDINTYMDVVMSLIRIEQWGGDSSGEPKLVFDGDLMDSVLTQDCQHNFALRIGTQTPDGDIDLSDTTVENQKRFALAIAAQRVS